MTDKTKSPPNHHAGPTNGHAGPPAGSPPDMVIMVSRMVMLVGEFDRPDPSPHMVMMVPPPRMVMLIPYEMILFWRINDVRQGVS